MCGWRAANTPGKSCYRLITEQNCSLFVIILDVTPVTPAFPALDLSFFVLMIIVYILIAIVSRL